MRRITALPNLLTLANAFCGLLAIAKAIDALSPPAGASDTYFFAKMQTACWLIFLGMVFDALDGKVARITGGQSEFGAQLDSFSDALTFGCAPALLAKVLIDHEAEGLAYPRFPKLHFIAAAAFALMAILRLVRFNLETTPDDKAHEGFRGLPSPAAAGAIVSTILMYLTLSRPELARDEGSSTPLGHALATWPQLHSDAVRAAFLPALACSLPVLGLLMVSRVPYGHAVSIVTRKGSFFLLVYIVFAALLLYVAESLTLFIIFNGFVLFGALRYLFSPRARHAFDVAADEDPAVGSPPG